jgi:hypothetical protein
MCAIFIFCLRFTPETFISNFLWKKTFQTLKRKMYFCRTPHFRFHFEFLKNTEKPNRAEFHSDSKEWTGNYSKKFLSWIFLGLEKHKLYRDMPESKITKGFIWINKLTERLRHEVTVWNTGTKSSWKHIAKAMPVPVTGAHIPIKTYRIQFLDIKITVLPCL